MVVEVSQLNINVLEHEASPDNIKGKELSIEDAMSQYGLKFGKQTEDDLRSLNRTAFPWGNAEKAEQAITETSAEEVKSAFEKEAAPLSEADTAETSSRSSSQSRLENRDEDSDGEEVFLCRHCNLPVGEIRYTPEGEERCKENALHGECMAQVMLAKMKSAECATMEEDKKELQEHREAFGIGWKTEHIPRNDAVAGKLAMRDVPQGMVCLVLNEGSNSVSLASTLEPAAAVNLEYLSTTLQVRRTEGHEPVFSLDPISADQKIDKHAMQEKVFVPEWLAGTRVGDVLFQADYHLKELSMGQQGQPVIGMKSCFDISGLEDSDMIEWSAREWFLVRKAEMNISENNALIPYVKMGVEAREQVVEGDNLLDMPVTRPDHPMVRYAEAFTKNFDLIAERKSVVFHLRELAKTSVLSKYLLDAGIEVEEPWFNLFTRNDSPQNLEVPQTWNQKMVAKLEMGAKSIHANEEGKGSHTHGVYGGVNFGLDKFNLTQSTANRGGLKASLTPAQRLPAAGSKARQPLASPQPGAAAVPPATLARLNPAAAGAKKAPVSVGSASALVPARKTTPNLIGAVKQLASVQGLLPRTQVVSKAPTVLATYGRQFTPPGMSSVTPPKMPHFAPPSASLAAVGAPHLRPTGVIMNPDLVVPRLASQLKSPTLSLAAAQAMGAMVPPSPNLQGVDLRLDNFDLSSATRVTTQGGSNFASDVRALDKCMAVGDAFWSSLDGSSKSIFSDEDHALLRKVFNPALSDRRDEKDLFCPPDASHSYIAKLRDLVKNEEALCESRKEKFCDKAFIMHQPGSEFPSSWTSSFEVSRAGGLVGDLDQCPRGALTARPEFKAHAEQLLSERSLTEVVFDKTAEDCMRFRIYRVGSLEIRTTQARDESEVVGAVFSIRNHMSTSGDANTNAEDAISSNEKVVHITEFVERTFVSGEQGSSMCRYYVVLETEAGHKIVTERLPDGKVTWEENPSEVEDRNSLAKVTRSATCKPGVVVGDLKGYQTTVAKGAASAGVASASVCKRYARSAYTRVAGAEGSRAFTKNQWWMDIAKDKMAKKENSFIALPNTMLKKV